MNSIRRVLGPSRPGRGSFESEIGARPAATRLGNRAGRARGIWRFELRANCTGEPARIKGFILHCIWDREICAYSTERSALSGTCESPCSPLKLK
eukprot:311214-Pyramimonas_sp.AAC.1